MTRTSMTLTKKVKPHKLEREKDVRREAAGFSRKMRKRKRRKTKRLQILFSSWLSKNYIPVEQGELRGYTKARLRGSTRRSWTVRSDYLTRCRTTCSG